MAMYRITRESIQQTTNDPCRHNWPLRVTVEAMQEGVDPNVFVYHAGEDGATGLEHGATFSNVASKQDMNVIPIEAPMAVEDATQAKDAYIPFFRVNQVELDCYNVEELERVWRIMLHDINSLVREYKAWDTLDNGQMKVVEV